MTDALNLNLNLSLTYQFLFPPNFIIKQATIERVINSKLSYLTYSNKLHQLAKRLTCY